MRRLVALCGAPGAGKTEVQSYLCNTFGFEAVDDGHPLRDFAMKHLGLSRWHVSTQAGKASMVLLPGGKTMTVREALGQLGNRIEEVFGPDSIPEMALMSTYGMNLMYCFGSVRRKQGRVYKENGATILEIRREGCHVINEFDSYDQQYVDHVIDNNSTVSELHARVCRVLGLTPPHVHL